jgi:hypothetical protein
MMEVTYRVAELARDRAEALGVAIDETPKIASKKFQSFTKAYLSRMKVGDEQVFPIPGETRSFVLKKIDEEAFSIRVVK